MNPSRKLTQKDLEGGEPLKEAISVFNNERTIDVWEFLRDSFVWIPCNAIMSEEDQKKRSNYPFFHIAIQVKKFFEYYYIITAGGEKI
ncbi:MAG: hypothetical protein ACI4SF_00020 [Oscillospiraceae bacterium]